MIHKYNNIKNISKSIDKAKIYGILDNYIIDFYDIVGEYYIISNNNINFLKNIIQLKQVLEKIELNNSDIICNNIIITPSIKDQIDNGNIGSVGDNGEINSNDLNSGDNGTIGGSIPGENGGNGTGNNSGNDNNTDGTGNSVDNQDNPNNNVDSPEPSVKETFILNDFIVNTEKKLYFNNNVLGDVYTFSLQDLLNNYSYSNIYSLTILRSNLDGGFINKDEINYYQNNSPLNILEGDLSNYNFIASSNNSNQSQFNISIRVSSIDSKNNIINSNTAILSIIKSEVGNGTIGNLPPTIGDIALKAQNRAVTVLNLAMFTTSLTPPYNDPENDLIDAIRIDEVSTANKGEFLYDNIPLSVNQIITREEINTGLLTHVGPNVNTIETDAINFSARDEGSKIWVQ